MTNVIRYTPEYLCMISDYGSPERHRHPTAHILFLKLGVGYNTAEQSILINGDIHEVLSELI